LEALGVEDIANRLLTGDRVLKSWSQGGDDMPSGAGIVQGVVVLEIAKAYGLGYRGQLVIGHREHFAFRCIPSQRQRTRQSHLRNGRLGAQKCRAQRSGIELSIMRD